MANRELYLEERRHEILRLVQQQGRVSVAELSRAFGVSEVTVRADLQALADQELIVRTHGGAVPANDTLQDLALASRRSKQVREKSQIGAAGAAMVEEGDAVYLDSSSTALAIAQHLKQRQRITVITSSLAVAQELLDAPGVTVVMPGGVLQRDTASLVGTDGLAFLQQYHIQKGFFGAHGIAKPEGLTDISFEVAAVKRPMVARCRQVVAVVDATKWGRVGMASFASLDEVHRVITDQHAPADMVAEIEAMGIAVIMV
ncbi:MAG: DeoR/GlpR transcriptional regulator [Caldilineae bacterium]|nr:MAG: DeoR/GlpR transcriptional regulator [Caldilineae bacterium]